MKLVDNEILPLWMIKGSFSDSPNYFGRYLKDNIKTKAELPFYSFVSIQVKSTYSDKSVQAVKGFIFFHKRRNGGAIRKVSSTVSKNFAFVDKMNVNIFI